MNYLNVETDIEPKSLMGSNAGTIVEGKEVDPMLKDSLGDERHFKRSILQLPLEENKVKCGICQRGCIIPDGGTGFCGTRVNRSGVLYSNIYGLVSVMMVSPIEKKPFYHFYPGSRWLSLGSYGCNFKCPGCQNWDISHVPPDESGRFTSPEEVVDLTILWGS